MTAPPTIQALSDTIVAQIEIAISQAVPLLPKAFVRVLAKVFAAAIIIVYKYAGWSTLQLFVAYASFSETTINGKKVTPLVEWGRLIGVGDPIAATRAEHTIEVTVENQDGSLAAGSQLLRVVTGIVYLTTAAVALDDDTVQVTIRAVADQQGGSGAGAIGNLDVDDVVQFANPLPNVAREATVLATTVTGVDGETEAQYRARILRRFQAKPQGGAYADYREWAEEVAGIAHAYPYTGDPGEVDVYVEATVESSGDPDGIPTGAQLTAVAASIELDEEGLATRRPANAAVNVLAITRTAFDTTVQGLIVDDEATVKEEIEAAVDEYLRSLEPYIVGLSVLPRVDRVTQAAIAGLVQDIVSQAGGTVNSVSVEQSATPVTTYTLGTGEKAKAGTFTYTA